jgi:DNA processing protein
MNTEQLSLWLKLIRSFNISVELIQHLQMNYPDLTALNQCSATQLINLGFNERQATAFTQISADVLAKDLEWLQQEHHSLLTIIDEDYPILLKNTADAPIALFIKGNRSLLTTPQLAMVGSRNPTVRGRETAHAFAQHLAHVGLTITSGLALGIDTASHEGALDAQGFTIAVCGTGLDRVYPARNHTLAQRIAATGALVSEFPLGTELAPFNFPRRNRIIAGLSVGTLVVEAALQSGSLITAQQALEAGREIFAIPGSIHNSLAHGCHRLIRQGAKLVESAEDVLEELPPLVNAALAKSAPQHISAGALPELAPEYRQLLAALDEVPTSIDLLATRTGIAANELASMLLILELQSLVICQPGGYTQNT